MAQAARAIFRLANEGTAAAANLGRQGLVSGKEIGTAALKTGEAATRSIQYGTETVETLVKGTQNLAQGATHVFKTVEQGLNIMKKQLEKKNIKSQARLQAFQSSMNQFKKQEENKLKKEFERHQINMQKSHYKTELNKQTAGFKFRQNQEREKKRAREERRTFYQSQIQTSLKEYRTDMVQLIDTLSKLFCDYKLTQNIGIYKCKYFPNFNTKTFKSRVYQIKEHYLRFIDNIEKKLMNSLRSSMMTNEYESFDQEYIRLSKLVIEVNEYTIGKITNIQNSVMYVEGVNELKRKINIELDDIGIFIKLKSQDLFSQQTFYHETSVVQPPEVSLNNAYVNSSKTMNLPAMGVNKNSLLGMNPEMNHESPSLSAPAAGGKKIKKKKRTRKSKKSIKSKK